MKRGSLVIVLGGLLLLLFLVACDEEEAAGTTPAAVEVVQTEAPAVTSTSLPPTNTPPPPTATPAPTEVPPTPTATEMPQPTATPLVDNLVQVDVIGADSSEPITGARVALSSEETGYDASFVTGAGGQALFAGAEPGTTAVYLLEVLAPAHQPLAMEIVVEEGLTTIAAELQPGVVGTTTILTNLRAGPGTTSEILAEIPEGETLPILAVSADGEWLQVQASDGQQGWVFARLMEVEGDLTELTGGAPIATATSVPATTATPTVTGTPPTVTATVEATPQATGEATTTPEATGEATTTPEATEEAPTGELPPRPAPVAFELQAFQESVQSLRATLENLGGVLDSVPTNVMSDEYCQAYIIYYQAVNTITTYNEIPAEWQELYDAYVDVADTILDSNAAVYELCQAGGGELSAFNRNLARSTILEQVNRLVQIQETVGEALAAEEGS